MRFSGGRRLHPRSPGMVETSFQCGDIVVQNGTRHAWRNRGGVPAKLVFVFVGAKRNVPQPGSAGPDESPKSPSLKRVTFVVDVDKPC